MRPNAMNCDDAGTAQYGVHTINSCRNKHTQWSVLFLLVCRGVLSARCRRRKPVEPIATSALGATNLYQLHTIVKLGLRICEVCTPSTWLFYGEEAEAEDGQKQAAVPSQQTNVSVTLAGMKASPPPVIIRDRLT